MSEGVVLPGTPGELADPLIGEARERQRKRRLWVTAAIALAVGLSAVMFATSHKWSVPFARWHTTNGDIIRRDVRATVVSFDNALANSDYARACRLLNPVPGQGVLRRATNAVGIHGSCEHRLGGVARILGSKRLAELQTARIYNIQYGGSKQVYAAMLEFNQEDISWGGYIPSVGVGRDGPHAPVLIQCAPVICGGPRVLQTYIDENRAMESARPAWVKNGVTVIRQKLVGDPLPDRVTWGVAATRWWVTLVFTKTETCAACPAPPPGATVTGHRVTETWDAGAHHQLGFSVYDG